MTNRKRLKMKMEKLWQNHLTIKAEYLAMKAEYLAIRRWYESLKKGD